MIYKFKSQATGDTILLGPQGDLLLRLLGREPAARGIIEAAALPAAIAALQAAVAADDAARAVMAAGSPAGSAESANNASNSSNASNASNADSAREPVSLRARLWPMVEMFRRAHAAEQAVVWGV